VVIGIGRVQRKVARLLELARKEAFSMVDRDPQLEKAPVLKKTVERFWQGRIDVFKTR